MLLAGTRYMAHVISEIGRETTVAVLNELSKRDAAVRRRLAGLLSVYPQHSEFVAIILELDAAGLVLAARRPRFLAQPKVYLFWRKSETS